MSLEFDGPVEDNLSMLHALSLHEPAGVDTSLRAAETSLKTWGPSVTMIAAGAAVGLFVGLVANLVLRRGCERMPAGSLRRALVQAWVGPLRWIITIGGAFAGLVVHHVWHGGVAGFGAFVAQAQADETNWLIVAELPFLTVVALRLTDGLCDLWHARAQKTEDTFDDQLVPLVRQGGKSVLVVGALLLGSQALGWDVTSLLAGLGIGGAAIALASKDTIANLFGSIVVFVDRPFQVGDWVELSGHEGTVEEVGLRTTRIRTFANSVITVPNSALTTSAINNWSRMQKRRIKLTLGVTYGASAAQLRAAVASIRELLAENPQIDDGFSLVNFNDFGASSLDIFVYCFTTTTNWAEYMQAREDLLLSIMERLQGLGLSFAFPSQSVYVEQLPGGHAGEGPGPSR